MRRRSWVIIGTVVMAALSVAVAPWLISVLRGEPWMAGPPIDVSPERVAEERTARGGDGVYAFMQTRDDGSPVRYNPCAPIHVTVNDKLAPDGTDGLVDEALDIVGDATGLVFENDGSTDEVPDSDIIRSRANPIPPVLIAWSDPDQTPELDGATTGLGGSEFSRGGNWYETGTIVLDAPQLENYLDGENGRAQVLAVILHEIAHVLGLGHVDDFVELMYPDDRGGVTTFGPGDLKGLALVGAGDCRDY